MEIRRSIISTKKKYLMKV